ncbi:MAG: FMN-binding protein [Candidatus Levybacteria bacterium]|nr:FMN-binding protein [Candidatus Levybacteria bacterium]
MKKFLLSFLLIFTFAVYVLHERFQNSDEVNVVPPSPTPTSSSTRTTTFDASSTYMNNSLKNGEYIGALTDAYYGNVQVKAVIQNGKIADVQFLQYPNDRRTSIEINTQAMPYLKQEAIQAQNANVDIVSGATQTSRAFRESLQSALDKAKI